LDLAFVLPVTVRQSFSSQRDGKKQQSYNAIRGVPEGDSSPSLSPKYKAAHLPPSHLPLLLVPLLQNGQSNQFRKCSRAADLVGTPSQMMTGTSLRSSKETVEGRVMREAPTKPRESLLNEQIFIWGIIFAYLQRGGTRSEYFHPSLNLELFVHLFFPNVPRPPVEEVGSSRARQIRPGTL
jgi:hypothetical protein